MSSHRRRELVEREEEEEQEQNDSLCVGGMHIKKPMCVNCVSHLPCIYANSQSSFSLCSCIHTYLGKLRHQIQSLLRH